MVMIRFQIGTTFYAGRPDESFYKKHFKVFIAYAFLCSIISPYTTVASQYCGLWDSIDALEGQYTISCNVWGSTPGEQCIEASSDSTYFSVTHSTHNSSGVAAYPFIYKGCHWGHCTQDSGMPVRISEVVNAPFSWSIDINNAGGTWNAAYESWFSITGGTAPNAAELMIWINYAGGAGPAGSKVATVTIGGTDWDVYFADWSQSAGWYYIAYKKTTVATSVTLDLKDFIDDSVARGYLEPEWYLDNMEAGFEIWRDGEGLTSNSFLASIDNDPPAVSITSPSDNDSFTEGAEITINANASDGDDSVTKVEFYQDSTKLGEAASEPYSYTWQSIPAGDLILTAVATDNLGGVTTSAPVHITVTGGGGSGRILREWWTDSTGEDINDLTSDVNFPDNPAGRGVLEGIEGPVDWADNYGSQIRGYLHPITTGDYTFWTASDANSELWLSTDADPCNATLIACVSGRTEPCEWDKYPQQQSLPISLTGGQKYYIEVLHKAGDGSDNLAVAWEGPGLNRQVIHGLLISPYIISFDSTIQKCTVKAGKTIGFDSILCSGAFGATAETLDAADNVTVQIYSGVDEYLAYQQTVAMDSFGISRDIYSYKYKVRSGQTGAITLLRFDMSKNTFYIKTKNIDLTGLGCPVYVLIDFGTYAAIGDANETVVNGKKLIPIRLMSGYADTLAVTKVKVKDSLSTAGDKLSIKGTITVADDSNVADGLTITWGGQTFTIPGEQFLLVKTGHFKSKYTSPVGSVTSADFNFTKCTFSINIKLTTLTQTSGSIDFALSFGSYDQTEEIQL